MNVLKHFGIVLIMTLYQFLLIIEIVILMDPIFQIIGNLFDGIPIDLNKILYNTIENIYLKVYSMTFLTAFFLAVFIKLIGGYWLSKISENKHKQSQSG